MVGLAGFGWALGLLLRDSPSSDNPKGVQKLLHQALQHPNLNNVRDSTSPSYVGLSVGGGREIVDLTESRSHGGNK